MAKTHRSKLVPLGMLLALLPLASAPAAHLFPGLMSFPLALLLDGLRAGFFVGLALILIGALRQHAANRTPPSKPS